jgi:uncharacterized protein (UPF0332 family)
MPDPPKKKHTKRPRPGPVVRISCDEQLLKAAGEYAKAERLLREAEVMVKMGTVPNASVHAAYYAMHHCANAVLLREGGVDKYGDVPKSHQHVIEHFIKLVGGSPELKILGISISEAFRGRLVADYELNNDPTEQQAKAALESSRAFLGACRTRWQLDEKPLKR